MKITNAEYKWIMHGLDSMCLDNEKKWEQNTKVIKNLKKKLEDEYKRLAKKNIEEGMTAEEEEIYPSRLDTEYGEPSIGRR